MKPLSQPYAITSLHTFPQTEKDFSSRIFFEIRIQFSNQPKLSTFATKVVNIFILSVIYRDRVRLVLEGGVIDTYIHAEWPNFLKQNIQGLRRAVGRGTLTTTPCAIIKKLSAHEIIGWQKTDCSE